jgi:hypothetical protein
MYVIKRKEKTKMEMTLIEITEEELKALIEKREAEARRKIAEEILEEIKDNLVELKELGYNVRLPKIGGKYISSHNPLVSSTNIHLSKW